MVWIVAAAACGAAVFLTARGQSAWAAATACLALVLSALLYLRLSGARTEQRRLSDETEAVLNSLQGGLLTVDREGRIRNFNPAAERILGMRGDDVRGRTLRDAFGAAAPLLFEKLERSLRERTPIHRFEMPLASGSNGRPIGLSSALLRTATGEDRGLLVTFQDLSDVVRMQERVRRADRLAAVGELAASIAHEIRNPLAAIANSTDMLRDELPVRGEQRKLMDLIVKESERLNRILDDFLEYARVRPLQAQVVPAGAALDEVVTLLRCHPDIGDELKIHVDDRTGGGAMVRIDESQIKQVYVNLALNAFEAMQHRGTLTVVTERCAGDEVGLVDLPCVRLRFRDTGPGLPTGEDAAIFEPFHTTKPHGTGLGLSIASRIVENHGGRIDATTLEQGGAEFSVYLPDGNEAAVDLMPAELLDEEASAVLAGGRGTA